MGAREMTYQPMLDYWMRMAGATFGCIGMAAGLALWRAPEIRSHRAPPSRLPFFPGHRPPGLRPAKRTAARNSQLLSARYLLLLLGGGVHSTASLAGGPKVIRAPGVLKG